MTATPTTGSLTPAGRDARFIALVSPKLPPQYRDGLPKVAQDVCRQIAEGKTEREEVGGLLRRHSDDDTLTADAATFVAHTAVQMYCPQIN